jgi:hypothetical protein
LIQSRKNSINSTAQEVKRKLQMITEHPVKVDDEEFKLDLLEVEENMSKLTERAKEASAPQINQVRQYLNKTSATKANFNAFLNKVDVKVKDTELKLREFDDEYG